MQRFLKLFLILSLLVFFSSCDSDSDSNNDTGTDTDSDTDTDTDTDSDTDTDTDTDSDTDSDTDTDTDADTDSDSDSDSINFSGTVTIDTPTVTGGTGMLCVGVFAGACPNLGEPLPEPIDGGEYPNTTLASSVDSKVFNFSTSNISDGNYGIAAFLGLTSGLNDCESVSPVSGDSLGCTDITVSGGQDVSGISIILTDQIP